MRRNIGLIVGLTLLFAACGDRTRQVYRGVEVKFVSVERMSEWNQGVLGTTASSDPRDEIALVHLEFRSIGGKRQIRFENSEMVLVDSQGNKHHPEQDLDLTLTGERKIPWELPFAVPQGVSLKTLQLGGTKFNLKKIKPAPANQ